MLRFESTWLAQISRRRDGVRQGTVLVACSGGGDSTALLAFLWRIRKSLGLELVVAHADHGLRSGSGEDAAFVRDLCRSLDLDLAEAWLDVKAHAEHTRKGLETAARDLRGAWLRAEAASCGASWVATGHTLDDHSETVLMRLLRNGGTGALTPLPARQDLRWSPLVEARREDLRTYLRQLGLPWREDPTNQEGFTPRNRLRVLLEELRLEAPALDIHLWETHTQVAELLEIREELLASWRSRRWDLETGEAGIGELRLRPPYEEWELRWILEAAFRILGWPRESALLRDLARWCLPLLTRRKQRTHSWGGWHLEPMPGGDWKLLRSALPARVP